MNRKNVRKWAAAGALVALAVWLGGPPLALADEPAPDSTLAAGMAGASVGARTATDTTTTAQPSPTVEPSTPVTDTEATPSPDSTPIPDAAPTVPGNSEEQGQMPPGAPAPTPKPTGEPSGTNNADSTDAQPTPSQTTPATEAARGHKSERNEIAGSIIIDDFGCGTLTTTVTIDNHGGQSHEVFTITVSRWTNYGPEQTWQHNVTVEPSAVQTVEVPLPDDSYTEVTVQSQRGGWAEKSGSCGIFVLDPRSTIAPFDCKTLSVSVVFDNTRSTSDVSFDAAVTGEAGISGGSDSVYRVVQAGEQMTVPVPLFPDAVNAVTVTAYGLEATELATSAKQTCGYLRHATVNPLDCGALTATIEMNNDSVPVPTRFVVQVGNGWIQRFETAVTVPAGTSKRVVVPLRSNSNNEVQVLSPSGWVLAEQSDVCGTDLGPQGRIGKFDCTSLSARVTLDASASEQPEWFMVSTADTNLHDTLKYYRVAAGSTKVVRVRLSPHARTYVDVYSGTTFDDEDSNRLASRDGSCGMVNVSKVDCTTMIVSVTLYGYDGWRGPVHYRVSTRNPQDAAAYSGEFAVRRGTTKVVKVPVAGLAGGRLRVEDLDWGDVVYEKPVAALCSAGSGSSTETSNTWSGPTALAATGAAGMPQLALVGVAMLGCGTALLGVSRKRRS